MLCNGPIQPKIQLLHKKVILLFKQTERANAPENCLKLFRKISCYISFPVCFPCYLQAQT